MLPHYAVKPIHLQDIFTSIISGDRLLISHVFNIPHDFWSLELNPQLEPLCNAACPL